MNSDVRGKVAREFSAKRTRALLDAKRRKEELYKACPALGEVDGQMARLSYEHIRADLPEESAYNEKMNALFKRKAELMKQMGNVDIEPHFECEICKDTGRTEQGYCKCFSKRVIEENLASANLSVSAAHETFENFNLDYYSREVDPTYGYSPYENSKKIKKACERFACEFEKPHKNLLLVGAPGLGKTFLSSAIARRVLDDGYTVVYISAAEFAARASANKFGENPQSVQDYYEADLLIIDDLGTEFKTGVTISAFGDILDRRLREGKKMVFSSNLELGELQDFYNERIISRFMGNFAYLLFFGDDIRRQKG